MPVKARCIFQCLTFHIKDKFMLSFIYADCVPRYGEELLANTEESSERENCVGNVPPIITTLL